MKPAIFPLPRTAHHVFEGLFWSLLVGLAIATGVYFYQEAYRSAFWTGVSFALLAYAGLVEPQFFRVKTYHFDFLAKEMPIRIAFLSDLHAGGFKSASYYDRVARRVAALKPDLIILGGDLVEDHASGLGQFASFQSLRAPLGKFFLLGNHDFLDDPVAIRRTLASWGYEDLTNVSREMEKDGGARFELMGVDDSWFGNPVFNAVRPKKKMPRVLVTHEPDLLLDLKKGDADLVILGHTHGGQVCLPLLGHVAPLPQKAPQWVDYGLKMWNDIPLVISRGLGEANARVRFYCRPEIMMVEL